MVPTREHRSADSDDVLARLQPRLTHYVNRSLGARARRWTEASDIVQKTIEEVWRSLDGDVAALGEDELLQRMFRTAQSRIRDVVRNNARAAGESVLGNAGCDIGVDEPSMGSVTREDRSAWLRRFVDRLPPKYAAVVRCCGLEGQSFVEAGATLGLEPDTVRKRYHTARETLARKLDGRADV